MVGPRDARYLERHLRKRSFERSVMTMSRRHVVFAGGATAIFRALFGVGILMGSKAEAASSAASSSPEPDMVVHTDAEWRKLLTPSEYQVLRQEGTERPFSSALNDEHRDGVFTCAACARNLFSSKAKFDSGTGWPSFWQPIESSAVGERRDDSAWMTRTEIHCSRCNGHLGHVFDDGPRPTGLRYCMNGVAMKFVPTAS